MKPDTKVSWAFTMLSISLSIYSLSGFVNREPLMLYWINIATAFIVPFAGIYLSFYFPEEIRLLRVFPYMRFFPLLFL